jgi:uncharacterized protein
MRKKPFLIVLMILVLGMGAFYGYFYQDPLYIIRPGVKIQRLKVESDYDGDGIDDLTDIVKGARMEIKNKTTYKSAYYAGGYPPEDEGVCTDVVWRALKNAGIILKDAMDEDIKKAHDQYSWIKPIDPNIDFRRVPNQHTYFMRNAVSLTTEVIPYDIENLSQWQPGDIVTLKDGGHVAIISDKRRKDGVPYIIHNASTVPKEQNLLGRWYEEGRIIGHFRYTGIEHDNRK